MDTRILITCSEPIGKSMSGPAIRALNLAIQLSKYFSVCLFGKDNGVQKRYNFEILPLNKKNVKSKITDNTVIISQGKTIWENPYLKKSLVPLIIDLYDPFIFEDLELNKNENRFLKNKLHEASLSILLEQLRVGDFFLCASERQKDFWVGMLAAINRINADSYSDSRTTKKLIEVVPFGVNEEEPVLQKKVLKGIYPGIEKDDKVVIWGGGVWDWLDPITAIEAMNLLKNKGKSEIKLFFMGVNSPNPNLIKMSNFKKMKEKSDYYELTGKTVFFNDWVDYEERHNYLLEADIGISLHHNHIETRFSYRTRIADYIWCRLPIVSTKGDFFDEIINDSQIGITIDYNDPQALANAFLELIKPGTKRGMRQNFDILKSANSWGEVVKPIIKFCLSPQTSSSKKMALKRLPISKSSFFFYKTVRLLKSKEYRLLSNKIRSRIFK